ncbi:hypothetical protein G7Y89_g7385 [Cudoniella acicularis]|uniref:Peptidase C14 caspase domain-containing protein n=1 Tax=Cudoniella acicularis TaxID=354080 RepID=A0A8H4RKK5_9HELO|nr:hypothetical protein G7Y89_g7385 [Cudoniella acicularis]
MFTATNDPDPNSFPVEDPAHWPTYDNVTSTFKKITFLANPGDFVYIHYSGHGIRKEPCYEFSNNSTGDLALVLLDGKENVRYFWGPELAFLWKAMVEKGLVVTLVLDCCFSVSVYRRDDGIRCLPYDAEIDSKYPLYPEKSLEYISDGSASRDANMLPNWLIKPDGYAMLVACGPNEVAKGITSADGQRHGALSYFLLRTLRKCGGLQKNHKDLYRHLCAKFRESWPQQNPVLYGNKNQGFFGHIRSESDITPVSIIERDGSLQLQAGQAHGICDGDQFFVCPLDSAENDSSSKCDLVIAKVNQSGVLTSDLELLGTTAICVQTGWIAKPLTRFALRNILIRLASELPHRDEFITTLKESSFNIHESMDEHLFSFHVVLNDKKEYEILDESDQKIINLPTMSKDQTDASYICDIIEHLARYKIVKDLANNIPADPFQETFSAHIITSTGECFGPECLAEVEQNEKAKFMFKLQVENKGNRNLYVQVYDMDPCWQVQDIYYGSYEVIPPQSSSRGFAKMTRKLKTIVPLEMREKGHRQCEDTIKVFITSQPTSFDLLELPKLGKSINRNRISRPSRGNGPGNLSEQWAALNFRIHTSLK